MRDIEELIEDLDAIDQQCGQGHSSEAISKARTRWDGLEAELAATSDEEIDHDLRLVLRRRLAEVGIEMLAMMYANGDASDALPFSTTLATLAPSRDLKEEIHGASNDQSNFLALCRARRELYDKPREARAALKKVIKESKEGGLQNAAKVALELPKPVNSAPALFTFNSVGLSLFGSRDRIGDTVIKTHALCVLFLPILPIGAYRVQDAGDDGYYFISKNRLSRFARFCQLGLLAGIILLVATVSIRGYLGSDSRQARLAMEDAQGLVEKGEQQLAITAYEDLINRYGSSGGPETMAKTGNALVSLYLAGVATPLTLDNEEEAHATIARFQALPAYVRGVDATKTMSDQVVAWAKELDGGSIAHQVASLRMLKEAEVLSAGSSVIATLRQTQELSLAAAITKERPVDGLLVYLETGEAGLPAAGEILRTLNLSQLYSARKLSKRWSEAATGDAEVTARMQEAQKLFGSEEHQALLADPEEKSLIAALAEQDDDQYLKVALANLMLADGRTSEALSLLQDLGRPGDMILSGQLSLAHAMTELGELDDADQVLNAYLGVRLGRFQEASKRYDTHANALQESFYEKARTGMLPHTLDSQLATISDEDEQLRVFEEWMYEEIRRDPKSVVLREEYEQYSDIVSAVLQQGMVKLQLANVSSGEEREAILAEAERSFLAIAATARGLPSYHLNLGQVYHRLGKSDEGDAEFAELLRENEPGLMLEVAYTYRELRLVSKAREIAEAVWNQKQEPYDSNAAVLVSMMASDLEEEEEWLLRANQDEPAIKVRLTGVQASRAQRDGRDAEADEFYAEVAAFHARNAKANENTASLNNGALANQSRYEVTGKKAHLDTALKSLERAFELTPQSAIVASNVVNLQQHHGSLSVLGEWIKIDEVRPNSSSSLVLLDHLSQGANRAKLLSKLQKNVTMRKARNVGKQIQLLAPNSFDAWESELDWHVMMRDVPALSALLKRVSATKFDTSEREKSRLSFQAGESDERITAFTKTSIVQTERLLEQARQRKHGPTIAALALLLSEDYGRLQGLTLDTAAAKQTTTLLKEASAKWPELATQSSFVRSLFQLALFKAVEGDDALSEFVSTQGRTYGIRPLMLRGPEFEAVKTSLMPKLTAQPEFSQAVKEAIGLGSEDPKLTFWLLGEIAGNAELMQLNAEALTREIEVLENSIRFAMDPNSKVTARRHDLYKAAAK